MLVGAISTLDNALDFESEDGSTSVTLEGEYAVYCYGDLESASGECEVRGEEQEPFLLPVIVQEASTPVLFPTTGVQEGSSRACIWWILCFCTVQR